MVRQVNRWPLLKMCLDIDCSPIRGTDGDQQSRGAVQAVRPGRNPAVFAVRNAGATNANGPFSVSVWLAPRRFSPTKGIGRRTDAAVVDVIKVSAMAVSVCWDSPNMFRRRRRQHGMVELQNWQADIHEQD